MTPMTLMGKSGPFPSDIAYSTATSSLTETLLRKVLNPFSNRIKMGIGGDTKILPII